MSCIDDLIEQCCPNGVELKPLGELGKFMRGGGPQKKHLLSSGKPCIHYGQIYTRYGLFTGETLSFVSQEVFRSSRRACPGDVIIADTSENDEDLAKSVAWVGSEEVAVSNHTLIYSSSLNPKYVSYFLSSHSFQKQKRRHITGVKVRSISENGMSKIEIPVPPLEVQDEIVRILDSFTQLEAELEAELEARRKQYEYYRDSLRDVSNQENHLGKKVEIIALEETCNISAGGDAPKDSMCKYKTDKYKVPIISNGIGENALYGYTDIAKINTPAVTIAARGTIGYAEYRDYPYFPIIRLLTAIPKDTSLLNTKYLYYCLQGKKYQLPNGGIPQLTAPQLKKVKIPVPPLSEQERIVGILDKFDALVNDLSSGLPAEIAARRKQYEYYRDRLLTFTPAK